MKKIMFDTNIFDKLANNSIALLIYTVVILVYLLILKGRFL
jgi:hypothetical protein